MNNAIHFCHARACFSKKGLRHCHNGLFCNAHYRKALKIREQLEYAKMSPFCVEKLLNEWYWRREEAWFRYTDSTHYQLIYDLEILIHSFSQGVINFIY